MPTLAEIAKLAGVSPAVVSRVVNKDATLRISKETLERVQRVVDEFGYTPNRAARSLRSSDSGLIALVVHDISNPVYAEIARGAHLAAAEAGKAIVVSDASGGEHATARLLELVGGRAIDGLILQADKSVSDLVLARAAREKMPIVLLQAQLDIDAKVVALPDTQAAEIGTRHLVERGHKRIGCIATVEDLSFTRDRITGWRNALNQNGLQQDDRWIEHAEPTIEAGRAAMAALLDRDSRLTAALCCNVVTAVGALAEALDRGLTVPQQMAIAAIHDIPLVDHLRIPLTTVSMPLFSLGKKAVERVLDPAPGNERAITVVAESPALIRRAST